MIYVVAGTHYRYLDVIKKLGLEGLPIRYVGGRHILANATKEDFYLVSGMVLDRPDYEEIMNKIEEIGLTLWTLE